jgi:hypothetical protein
VNVRRSTAKASVVVTAAVLALGLSSCGFGAPTDQLYNPPVGVNEISGNIDVLNAVIVSDGGGTGTLVATLVNNDPRQADSLTNISGAGADQVEVEPPSSTDIDAAGLLSLSDIGGATVSGDAVKPGYMVSLTFSFAHSESVEVDVPVYRPDGPYADFSPSA